MLTEYSSCVSQPFYRLRRGHPISVSHPFVAGIRVLLNAECCFPFNTLPTIHCPIPPFTPHFSPFIGISVPYTLPLNRIVDNEPAGELHLEDLRGEGQDNLDVWQRRNWLRLRVAGRSHSYQRNPGVGFAPNSQ